MPQSDSRASLRDEPPWSDHLTDYDRAHFDVYLRLLDATQEKAEEHEIMRIVLCIDPLREPKRAQRMFDSHLKRALWMTENGYRHLLHS